MPGEPWTWITSEAFGGKTALLAHLASNPPPGHAVVSCFIRRTEGRSSADSVLGTLNRQLAALTWREPFDPHTHGPAEQFTRLLELAATACVRRGDHVLLVLDGLDEYDPYAATALDRWLPMSLPEGVCVVAAGRPEATITAALPGHPLWQGRVTLDPFTGASEVLGAARRELELAIHASNGVLAEASAYMAAMGGGLTADELAILCQRCGTSVTSHRLEDAIDAHLDRTTRWLSDPLGGPPALVFTHDLYKTASETLTRPHRVRRAREQVDAWVDESLAAGWPEDTPRFALGPYGKHLVDRVRQALDAGTVDEMSASTTRLLYVTLSPHRWLAVMRGEQTPAAADAEVVAAQGVVRDAASRGQLDPDRATVSSALLGLKRGLVTGQVARVAPAVAFTWALHGQAGRARELAESIREPDARTAGLFDSAAGAALAGDPQTASALTEVALQAVAEAGPFRDKMCAKGAASLAAVGAHREALAAAAAITAPEHRAWISATVAFRAARQQSAHTTLALSAVRSVPVLNTNAAIFWAYGRAAEAATLIGERQLGETLLQAAVDGAHTGFGPREPKYRHWAGEIVSTARLRLDAQGVPTDDSPNSEVRLSDLIARASDEIVWNPSRGLWHAAHLASAASRAHPEMARDLAGLVVDRLLSHLGGGGEEAEDLWDEDATWLGARPSDLLRVLMDAGLVDAALTALDRELPRGPLVREGDSLRRRLAGELGSLGRLDEAVRAAARITDMGVRLAAHACAGAKCLAGTQMGQAALPAFLSAPAQGMVARAFEAAVAAEFVGRDLTVRRKLSRAVTAGARHDSWESAFGSAGPDPQRSFIRVMELDELLTTTRSKLAAEMPADIEATPTPPLSRFLDGSAFFMDGLKELSSLSTQAAERHIGFAEKAVAADYAILRSHRVDPRPAFAAARDLVLAYAALEQADQARGAADVMLDRLTAEFPPHDLASCLGKAIDALEAAGGVTAAHAQTLLALTRGCRAGYPSAHWAPMAFAVAFSRASPPALDVLAPEILALVEESRREHLAHRANLGMKEWYEPTAQLLDRMLAAGQSGAAGELGQTMLSQALDGGTQWYERGHMLGLIVRSGEPGASPAALPLLLSADSFSEHVECLPDSILRDLHAALDELEPEAQDGTA